MQLYEYENNCDSLMEVTKKDHDFTILLNYVVGWQSRNIWQQKLVPLV